MAVFPSISPNVSTPTLHPPIAPRHWPTWLGFGLVWLATRLPYLAILALCRALGGVLHRIAGRRRRIAEINIELCFPELDAEQRRQLVRDHFSAMATGIFEMGMAWWLPQRRIRALARVEGVEHLEAALARGKGVLLLSAHFTPLELSGRIFSTLVGKPWSGMYRPHENAVVEYLFRRDRSRFFEKLIPRDDIRAFLRALRRGEAIWYAPDQNYDKKGSVTVPFFGIPAPTNPATSRLARISGAAVVPFEYRRLPGSEGYLLAFHPPLEAFGGDEVADTARVNAIFEEMIRRAPEQYFWMHRRFKKGRTTDIYRERGL